MYLLSVIEPQNEKRERMWQKRRNKNKQTKEIVSVECGHFNTDLRVGDGQGIRRNLQSPVTEKKGVLWHALEFVNIVDTLDGTY
jgi:hypothetical protein